MADQPDTFDPDSVGDLVQAILGDLRDLSARWWNENASLVEGYTRSLAEATMQTRTALIEKRIRPDEADRIMHMQELAFNSLIHFTKFMTFSLAQKALDRTFRLVGLAIFNRTGVNLFPHLVDTAKD